MNPLALLKLAWAARKAIGIAAAAAFLGWLAIHTIREYGQQKADAAREIEHALWQADIADRDKVAAQVIIAQAEKAKRDQAHNNEVESEYLAKMDKLSGERDRTFGLLQRARGEILAGAAREATGTAIAATAGEAGIADRIDHAVAGVVAESRANADQLDALIAVVKPQL